MKEVIDEERSNAERDHSWQDHRARRAESELPDGQRVTVMIKPMTQPEIPAESPLEALKRAAGSWSDDPEGLE